MKKILLIIFVIALILAAIFYIRLASSPAHTIQVKDVTQKQILTLIEKDRPKYVHGISILITGYIDGTATIQRAYENKEMYGPSTITGKVNLRLGGDWYGDKCLITYQPFNVRSGKLQIKYDFRTLKSILMSSSTRWT